MAQSWVVLGRSCGALGLGWSWAVWGLSWGLLGTLEPSFGDLGAAVARPWRDRIVVMGLLGAIWGWTWEVWEMSWAVLGRS